MRKFIVAAVIAVLPLTAIAQEDSPQMLAVKARQGFYEMLNANMGVLAAMAKGDMAYDENRAVRSAANIEALSHYDLPMHFLEGTSTDDMPGKTAAKPDIWLDVEDFGKKYIALRTAAVGITDEVKGGQNEVGAVVAKMGQTCKNCHDSYRQK